MKRLLLVMLFISTFTHARLKDYVIINDVKGDVQVRTTHTSSWKPLTAGMIFTSNTFVRLNTPDSIATVQYPDGGILKLLGMGSYLFEDVSNPKNNIYHSKMLVFSGRWYYHSQKDFRSRFIVNSDITTSVVEQGSGGGYFHQGTNEFLLYEGRGLISYRQEEINAIVVEERQYVDFNILDGFFNPKLATEEKLRPYMIFQTNNEISKQARQSSTAISNTTANHKNTTETQQTPPSSNNNTNTSANNSPARTTTNNNTPQLYSNTIPFHLNLTPKTN